MPFGTASANLSDLFHFRFLQLLTRMGYRTERRAMVETEDLHVLGVSLWEFGCGERLPTGSGSQEGPVFQ